MVLLGELGGLQQFALFFNLMITLVMVVLSFLLSVLMYSLLMVSVETRTFELGIMRMVGMRRVGIVRLLLVQALSVALPGWTGGLLVAQIASAALLRMVSELVSAEVPAMLVPGSIVLASVLGIAVPLLASVIPIRAALSANLQSSLDVAHSKTSAITVTVERANARRLPAAVIGVGVTVFVFGFCIYYLFPLALLSMHFELILDIFVALIIVMLLGLVMLGLAIETAVERMVVAVFFWWDSAAVYAIVRKNLVAHKLRNRKSTIMYALSLGFIIFTIVSFKLQTDSLLALAERGRGATFKVDAGWNTQHGIEHLRPSIERWVATERDVVGMAYISSALNVLMGSSTDLHSLGKLYTAEHIVYAVSPNFFEVSLAQYLSVFDAYAGLRIGEQLYSARGSQSVVVSEFSAKTLHVGLNDSVLLAYRASESSENFARVYSLSKTRLGVLAVLRRSPFFKMSRFAEGGRQSCLVSFPTFVRLTLGKLSSAMEVPIRAYFIRASDGLDDAALDRLKRSLQSVLAADGSFISIDDARDAAQKWAKPVMLINAFSYIVTAVVLLVCFFSLMSSMVANIQEQAKEIGVLRSIGLRKGPLFRIYLYEAFTVVVAASLIGATIGTIVSFTMTQQQAVFTTVAVPFYFPLSMMCVVVIVAFFSALLSAGLPIRRLLQKRIVSIMRTIV